MSGIKIDASNPFTVEERLQMELTAEARGFKRAIELLRSDEAEQSGTVLEWSYKSGEDWANWLEMRGME